MKVVFSRRVLAHLVVVEVDYSIAFLALAAIAGTPLPLFWLAMPETRDSHEPPDPISSTGPKQIDPNTVPQVAE